MEDESYLWTVTRYVHLNPVRAGLVQHPAAWNWSSYVGYVRIVVGWSGWRRCSPYPPPAPSPPSELTARPAIRRGQRWRTCRRHTAATNAELTAILGVSRTESVPNLTRRFQAWLSGDSHVRKTLKRLDGALSSAADSE